LLFTITFITIVIFLLPGVPAGYQSHESMHACMEIRLSARSLLSLLLLLWPVIIAMMLTNGISASLRAWTPSYLHVAYAQTPAASAALSGLVWAISVLSRLGAAIVITRIGAWRMVMLGTLITLCGLIAMLFSPNVIIGTIAITITTVGISPLFATLLAIGSERAGWAMGTVAGILLFTTGISTVFCSWFFGFLLNTAGPAWTVMFCTIFVGGGGLMALQLRRERHA
jgi:hypothetical protein